MSLGDELVAIHLVTFCGTVGFRRLKALKSHVQLHMVSGVGIMDRWGLIQCAYSMIEYPNYKFHFSIRALGHYEHHYLPGLQAMEEFKR